MIFTLDTVHWSPYLGSLKETRVFRNLESLNNSSLTLVRLRTFMFMTQFHRTIVLKECMSVGNGLWVTGDRKGDLLHVTMRQRNNRTRYLIHWGSFLSKLENNFWFTTTLTIIYWWIPLPRNRDRDTSIR